MPRLPDERPSQEVRMRRALVAVLTKLGLVGKVVPSDEVLLRLAAAYDPNMRPLIVDDLGRPVNFVESPF